MGKVTVTKAQEPASYGEMVQELEAYGNGGPSISRITCKIAANLLKDFGVTAGLMNG